MKKTILALAAMMIISATAMAQNEDRRGRNGMDRTEIVKRRTEATVKKYDLNAEQAQKLLELNTKYQGQMWRGMGNRAGRNANAGKERAVRRDTSMRKRTAPATGNNVRIRPDMKEMRENMRKYDEELKTIMTSEQYAKYQKDIEARRQAGRK